MAARSSDSLPAPGISVSHVNSRIGTPLGRHQDVAGAAAYGWIIAALIVVGVVAVVSSDNNENKSPG